MLLTVFILFVALATLVISADKFVLGASSLARNLGVSPMIIGLTIVAMGSSAPEMMVAATAALQGKPDTAIGNAIGSNITNIALVLGVSALLKPLAVSSSLIRKELPLLLIVSAITLWMLVDNHFSFVEGALLMLGFMTFIGVLLVSAKQQHKTASQQDDPLLIEAEQEIPQEISTQKACFWLLFGLILLPISAEYLVQSAVFIAKYFGLSDLVIGLTIIAIGTSLPELAASIVSIYKKEDDLAIGNIIGSNLFNLLAVLSLAGIISPGKIDPLAATRDAPIMVAITLLLLALCFSRRFGYFRITRLKGAVLVSCFIGYQILLFA